MRYLLLLLCMPMISFAQPGVELNASGGILKEHLIEQKVNTFSVSKRWAAGIGLDVLGNKNSRPLTFSYGLRIGMNSITSHEENFRSISYPPYIDTSIRTYQYQWLMIALPVGVQYRLALSRSLGLRFSAAAGPMVVSDQDFQSNRRTQIKAYTEASAGVLLSNRFTIGIKFIKPFGKYGNVTDYIVPVNNYTLHSWQASVSMILPGMKDLKPSRVAKIENRMAETHKMSVERKASAKILNEKKSKPSLDIIAGGNLLFPKPFANYSGSYSISNAGLYQIGVDLMFNSKRKNTFASILARTGVGGFTATQDKDVYRAGGIHGSFGFGFNYISNPAGNMNILTHLALLGGFRLQGNGPFPGNPFYQLESGIGLRFNHRMGFDIYAMYMPFEAYKGNPLHVSNAVASFQGFGAGAQLRLSLGKYR